MSKKVKTHSFRGIVHDIDVEGAKGLYEEGEAHRPCLFIARPRITMKESLPYNNDKYAKLMAYILLHECLHASFPDMSEKQVDQASKDISRLFWRLGYRRIRR